MAKKYVRKSNLDALKNAVKSQGTKGGFQFWKPQKYGEYLIRFLPPKQSDGLFYKEVAQHKVGDNYFYCPKVEGDQCPICETYRKLWDKGTDAAIELAREIKPRKQFLYNIIVKEELGKPSDTPTKVQKYMSGKKVFDKLMDYFFDDDYGDLTDVEEGFDFVLKKTQGDMGFPNYDNSKPKRKASPLHEDEDTVEEILDESYDLDAAVEFKSYEELSKSLGHFLEAEKGMSVEGPTAVAPKSKPSKADDDDEDSSDQTSEDSDDDEDDFDDFEKQLLNELED